MALRLRSCAFAAALLAALAFAARAWVACSSFSEDASPSGDAAASDGDRDSATDGGVAADANDTGPARFCERYSATAILCEDFEENDGGILGVWKSATDGGTLAAAAAPMRGGHAVKVTATGQDPRVGLELPFPVANAKAGVVFEADILIDTGGYDYIELTELHTSVAGDTYFGGMAKSGGKLGREFTPFAGPTIDVDNKWHHIRVELVNNVGPGATGDAGAFTQTVTLDSTVVQTTNSDMSKMAAAQIDLGVLAAIVGPGQPLAVIYFDDIVLRSR